MLSEITMGMQPHAIAWNKRPDVGVSPCGTRQYVEACMACAEDCMLSAAAVRRDTFLSTSTILTLGIPASVSSEDRTRLPVESFREPWKKTLEGALMVGLAFPEEASMLQYGFERYGTTTVQRQ